MATTPATAPSNPTQQVTTTPFKSIEPVNKINGIVPGGICTIELPPGKRLDTIMIEATVTKAAVDSTKTFPLVSDIIGLIQLKVAGKPERTRLASELFGATGLNALNWSGNGGTVVYSQSGNTDLSVVPVLIGSADDVTQQGLLTEDTATTAVFELPLVLAERFRTIVRYGDMMSLVQSFTDGSSIGVVTVELTIPDNTGDTPAFSGHNIEAEFIYDNTVAKAGNAVRMSKEYRQQVQYSAAGDIELATQLYNRDLLQRVSLLTTSDQITRVVVKQGQTILRDLFAVRNQSVLRQSRFNGNAIISNRFDIEFDLNGDPNSCPALTPNQPLSIVGTLATASDSTKNIVVLSSYYGPLD